MRRESAVFLTQSLPVRLPADVNSISTVRARQTRHLGSFMKKSPRCRCHRESLRTSRRFRGSARNPRLESYEQTAIRAGGRAHRDGYCAASGLDDQALAAARAFGSRICYRYVHIDFSRLLNMLHAPGAIITAAYRGERSPAEILHAVDEVRMKMPLLVSIAREVDRDLAGILGCRCAEIGRSHLDGPRRQEHGHRRAAAFGAAYRDAAVMELHEL